MEYLWLLYLCLNPCSCGGWSQSMVVSTDYLGVFSVLILVLVEDGLRVTFGL